MGLIIGHLIGDYVLQFDWMAARKKEKGMLGLSVCVLHCLVWATSVYIFTFLENGSLLIFLLVFLSHFIIDRTLIVKWFCTKVDTIIPTPTWKLIVVDNALHLLLVYGIQNLVVNSFK